MNREILKFLVVAFIASCLQDCSSKKEDHVHDREHGEQRSTDGEAAAMDSFHLLMAETFHPFKDSADLGPIKDKAGELAAVAERWARQPLPTRIRNEKVKLKLQQLEHDARALADLVKTGTDEEIGASLVRLHELFHELHYMWSSLPEGEDGHAM